MVYIDEEGLEEQFLTGDEASQEVMDITANRVHLTREASLKTGSAQGMLKLDIGNTIVEQQLGVDYVHQKHTQLKPAESMQTL